MSSSSDNFLGSNGGYQNELFTWKIKAGANRVYYVNVKEDKNGELYIVIKESKSNIDGGKEVHRVMIFQKDFRKFISGLQKALDFIKEHPTGKKSMEEDEHSEDSESFRQTANSSYDNEEINFPPDEDTIELN